MSDASAAFATDGPESNVVYVQFANTAGEAPLNGAPPLDWAFAAPEGGNEGEALDTLSPEQPTLPPLMAIAAYMLAENEMYDSSDNPLVSFEPAASSEETGHIIWSGEDLVEASEPQIIESHGEYVVVLHDAVSHGISLDWTDPLYS